MGSLLVLKVEQENDFIRRESKGSSGEGVKCMRNKMPHVMNCIKEVEDEGRGEYWFPAARSFNEVPKLD